MIVVYPTYLAAQLTTVSLDIDRISMEKSTISVLLRISL